MSQLTCGGCGSVYALAGVQSLDSFQCSTCQRVIVVPIAGPSAARAAQGMQETLKPDARGGVWGRIVAGGAIRVGDALTVESGASAR